MKTAGPQSRKATPRWRRVALYLALTNVVVVGTAIGLYAFAASETALALAVRLLIARSDGRLEVEAPAGSLLSELRVKRLVWRGPEATLTADDVALNWNPAALWSRGIVVKGLGAQHIAVALQPSDSATPPPVNLGLPTDVAIDNVAVAKFDWRIGTSSGTITGVTFGYAGGASVHRVDNLSLVTSRGTMSGSVAMDARPPFAVTGAFAFAGDAAQADLHADVTIAGTLPAISVDATGRAGEARLTFSARLTPLAAVALEQLALDAQDVDLAILDDRLPSTRLGVKAEVRPIDRGIAGSIEAVNSREGPLDAKRLPVHALRSRFSWRDDTLALDEMTAELTGGGRAAGNAQVPFAGNAGKLALEVRDVDLRQIHSSLRPTRLSGTLGADLDSARQRIEGNVADRTLVGGVGLSFAATVADKRFVFERMRIRAGDGEFAGSGHIEFAGTRAFDVVGKLTRIDPARFGDFPAGNLGADIAVNGALEPEWHLGTMITIADGSRLSGVPLSGTARATLARRAVRDVVIDLRLASAKLTARGSAGDRDDGLTVALDAPQLADLVPLLPSRVPRPLAGKLRASAVVRGDFERGAFDFTANGEALKVGPELALGTFAAQVSLAPTVATSGSVQADQRALKVDLAATDVVAPPGTFPRGRASIDGSLAQHKVSISLQGADLDVDATAHGGARESSTVAATTTWAWSGTVDTLENRGPWAVRLAAPATLELARDHVRLGAARLEVADGNVALATLAWDGGRITTRGAFTGVPVATIAKLAGAPLPFVSTLTLAGDWSLAAAPRLNGALNVRRERGDLAFGPETLANPDDRAFRITALDVSARFRDDAVDATATFRSGRGLDADAQLAIGVAANAPPGHLAADAPLQFALKANLASLKVLQPWVGTTAIVDGNASVDLVARGTIAKAPLSGTLRGDALRIEAPQYGMFFTGGHLAARLADGALWLDELSFEGGAGRFTASGTLASTGEVRRDGQGAAGRVTWHAEKFRVFNRPDLRLVVGGSGTLVVKDRKISLDGTIVADEGRYEHASDVSEKLGDDVVVKGWPRDNERTRAQDLPLALDLELDLGQRLTFVGEGLETGLRGKVRVTTATDGGLRGRGSIQTVNGTYFAFGQRLVIDRGRLIFDGPLDNPGLDIVALRKNIAVEAGVAVSGTVKVPIIQLTSIPPVPDNEKLSWLVLGQGLDRTSGADIAALQAASAALLGRGGKSVTSTVAERIGLDDISVGRSAASTRSVARGGTEAPQQVVAFGKRITDNLSLVYQQGLTVATNALRLEYSLSRSLSLRAEAGAISSFGIYFRRSFD